MSSALPHAHYRVPDTAALFSAMAILMVFCRFCFYAWQGTRVRSSADARTFPALCAMSQGVSRSGSRYKGGGSVTDAVCEREWRRVRHDARGTATRKKRRRRKDASSTQQRGCRARRSVRPTPSPFSCYTMSLSTLFLPWHQHAQQPGKEICRARGSGTRSRWRSVRVRVAWQRWKEPARCFTRYRDVYRVIDAKKLRMIFSMQARP